MTARVLASSVVRGDEEVRVDTLMKERREYVAPGPKFEERFGKADFGLAGEEGTRRGTFTVEEGARSGAERHFGGP